MTALLAPPRAPVVDDITRRRLLGGAGLLLLAGGCGSDARQPGSGTASGGFPVTVEHAHGSTEIPRRPQRVVTIGFSDQDPVFALGVTPVGVTDWYGDYPFATWLWARDELGDARPAVLNKGEFTGAVEPDFEAIAVLRPDVILGLYTGVTRNQYDTLSQIAPTVPQSGEFPDFGTPWQEMTRTAGRALGREQRAAEAIAGVEERFAEARAAHPEFRGLSAVVAERSEPGSSFVRSPNDPRSQFMTSLGFEIPAEIGELAGELDGATVSDERIALIDRDVLVWNFGTSEGARASLEANPLYRQLDVVRDGRVVYVADPVVSGALTWSTVLSIPFALDALVPTLAATVGVPR